MAPEPAAVMELKQGLRKSLLRQRELGTAPTGIQSAEGSAVVPWVLSVRSFFAIGKARSNLLQIEAMKKIQKPSPTEINVLLRRAEDYATSSLGGVLVGLEEDPVRPNRLYRNYTQLMHGLEDHYLFPNLNRGARKVLSDLLDARNKLVVRRQGGTRSTATGGSSSRVGSGQALLKRRFRELKTRAKALGRSPVLTPVQREVLGQLLLPNL